MFEASQIVHFCRFLRDKGFAAGVSETLDSLAAAPLVPTDSIKFALRSELCSSKEEWDRFDDLFAEFWGENGRQELRPPHKLPPKERGAWALIGNDGNSAPRMEEESKQVTGASLHERLRRADFSDVPQEDQAALERIAERLMKRTSFRLSRRLKISESPAQVDLRRTIRRSIGRGGDPVELRYKGKKPKQARLVILLDVSGSMSLYSFFLLRFAHALQKHFQRAETFVFSTSLIDITSALRHEDLADALQALSRKAVGWTGGTKIGESLREFNLRYARKSLTSDTLFLILSDGWDTGEPEALAAELAAIQRRVKKLIWLNPLLGLDDYRPVTRGMAAALPYVDVFAPAHSLDSLLDLEKHLTSPARR
jgi:uncharacterized protein with von Willebrand factor type A (vWA) domain